MSYCRWGVDGSNVYVIYNVVGFYQCVGCPTTNYDIYHTTTATEMVEHLLKHIAAGDVVPQYAIDGLLKEDEE